MARKRMRIFVGGQELYDWTSARLSRKKKDMTGTLTVSVFFPYIPNTPVYVQAMRGKEILAYVDDKLAFTGILDKRKGSGAIKRNRDAKGRFAKGSVSKVGGSQGEITSSISENSYSVTLEARGKTKYLIDSSHQLRDNMVSTKSRDVAQNLIDGFGVDVDWQAENIDIPKKVFRDGATVCDEIIRLCNEHCYFVYETRDGKLKVSDGSSFESGAPLILGENILTFSSEQSEDKANSSILVKGHRTKKGIWGKDAVNQREVKIGDSWVVSHAPLIIQHYGDATDEALERRGKWEADRRASESKNVRIEIPDVISDNGDPFDIGKIHYVEIPPEGIFDYLECIELQYEVDAETCKTTLTLAPAPSSGISGGTGTGAVGSSLTSKNKVSSVPKPNAAARNKAGVEIVDGKYPSSWGSANLSVMDIVPDAIESIKKSANSLLEAQSAARNGTPPLTIKPSKE